MDLDRPAPSPLDNDDDPISLDSSESMMGEDRDPPHAGMGENLNGEVYGLSNLRRSRRIADGVEKIGRQRWRSNASVDFVNDREESDEEEEEEDIDDDGDSDIASDEGLDGYDDDDDELFAGPGLEGISLWDSLGEGFLKEASQLGMSFRYYCFLKF
jgi:hypothetical protein